MSTTPIAPLHVAPFAYGLLFAVLVISIFGFFRSGFLAGAKLYPYEVARMRVVHGVFTASLVHTGWGHLMSNLLSAVFFVPEVEYMLVDDFKRPAGWAVFLLVFFGIALFSSAVAVMHYRARPSYSTLGLSAVVFGMASFFYFYLPLDKNTFGGIISGNVRAYQMGCFGLVMLLLAIRYNVAKAAPIHFYGAVGGLVVAIFVRPALVGEIFAHVVGW